MGAPLAILESSCADVEGLWSCLGAILQASWAVLGGRKPEQAKASKSLKNIRKNNILSLLGLSSRASWSSLGPYWAVLEGSWAVLMPSWGPLEPSWAILGHLGVSLAVLEAVLEAILAVWRPKRAPERQNQRGLFFRGACSPGGGGSLETMKKPTKPPNEHSNTPSRAGTAADLSI